MDGTFPRRGFTLIELLIVVAIIAILAAIAVPNFLEAQVRSKVARVKSDFRSIKVGMESYAVDNNRYPLDYDSGDGPGGVGHNDFMTWVALTTPVAYLTSVLENPFRDPRAPKNPHADIEVYEFWGGAWFRQSDSLGQFGVAYRITSVGPDLYRDGAPSAQDIQQQTAAFADCVYDPTNGTRSGGDLLATNQTIY
ncbi:MAG TPA: prepilin-type N-terminal cleavage/methylation domain-containing protein [Sumerlaeia bacterium]|nr:prepilin-type N-terminal cleavage/methylation domain-containing protein [Sumerlaeia bacterium]